MWIYVLLWRVGGRGDANLWLVKEGGVCHTFNVVLTDQMLSWIDEEAKLCYATVRCRCDLILA